MIRYTATIIVGKGVFGELSNATINVSGINISADIQNVVGKMVEAKNPFLIGISKLNGTATFSNKVDYYIGKNLSNNDGVFETPYEIILSGTNITAIFISFDTLGNKFPRHIYIDDVSYYNESSMFFVANLPSSNSHTIRIADWNAPNSPVIITGLTVETVNSVDRNITSASSDIAERTDLNNASYGVLSNRGQLSFVDIDSKYLQYYNQRVLSDNFQVELFIENTLNHKKEKVGSFNSGEWNYDKENRVVDISLKDDLEEWQNINTGIFDLRNRATGLDIYNFLVAQTPSTYEFEPLDKETTYRLNIPISYPYMDSSNLWSQWNKLANATALHIYKNSEGKVSVHHSF
jgi:hypothetical protein